MSDRQRARDLARAAHARGDHRAWFETLYAASAGAAEAIPWADMAPNPGLLEWMAGEQPGVGRCLVVGCGLGDDAEALAAAGWTVTAFDIAPSAIAWCRRRYPGSSVSYVVADLFAPPAAWRGAFELVFEAYTLQVLPPGPQAEAMACLARWVAPEGRLLLIARARDGGEPAGQLPWPLAREDLAPLEAAGLEPTSCERYLDDEDPPVERWRAVYRRASCPERP